MPELVIVWWRDIPAQVVVRSGRQSAKRELPEIFAQAIDRAAMKSGAQDTDAYLAGWRRDKAVPCGDDLEAEADRAVAELLASHTNETLRRLIENGGSNGR